MSVSAMRISCNASSLSNLPSSVKGNLKTTIRKSGERIEIGRRIMLPFLVVSVAAVTDATSESQKTLLQEYLKRSKENKAKNDKERLDSYYKRNYQDYFEFIEGSTKDKTEDQLTESEKSILDWLKKNKK
ncbi:hypothetical protein LUZ60_006172 [Juncus effusus]|nr:hypothetical protein LUZ60_006172 [Juncus effusus]